MENQLSIMIRASQKQQALYAEAEQERLSRAGRTEQPSEIRVTRRLVFYAIATAAALLLIAALAPAVRAMQPADPTRTHVVQSGDTLRRIAVQYGTTPEELVNANKLPYPYTLTLGQPLTIPAGVGKAELPGQAVKNFYSWYLQALRDGSRPFESGLFEASPYLTEELKQQVFDSASGHFDPFLCSQAAPETFTVENVFASATQARVIIGTGVEGYAFTIALMQDDDAWKISDVICQED